MKIIAVVEDDVLSDLTVEQQEKDAQIKAFMVRRFVLSSIRFYVFPSPHLLLALCIVQANVHTCYVNYLMNPFNKVAAKIQSEQFDQAIEDVAMSFNQEV